MCASSWSRSTIGSWSASSSTLPMSDRPQTARMNCVFRGTRRIAQVDRDAREEHPHVRVVGRPHHFQRRTLDVAVNGDGWLAVQAVDGSEAYTRAGNLRVNINGQLLTGAGHPVMGESGPIVIPEFEKLEIGRDGTISVRPIGQQPSTLAEVGRIKLVAPEPTELVKGEDGLLRMRTGAAAAASTDVTLLGGALELSNVNSVEALVDMIGLARQFEMSVKIMQTAKEMDEKTAQLMSLG